MKMTFHQNITNEVGKNKELGLISCCVNRSIQRNPYRSAARTTDFQFVKQGSIPCMDIFYITTASLQLNNKYILMNKLSRNKMSTHQKILLAKAFPKKRMAFKKQMDQKYIIDTEFRQIHHVITERSKINNTSIVTFKFDEKLQETTEKRIMTTANLHQHGKRRSTSKDIYLQTLKPVIPNFNFSSLHIGQCQVRRLDSENHRRFLSKKKISQPECNFAVMGTIKSVTKMAEQGIDEDEPYQALLTGIKPNLNFRSQKYRKSTSANFRVKQYQINEFSKQKETITQNASIIQKLRKPSLRKDYFVFGMGNNKMDLPESRNVVNVDKIQIYRDFLWKINFSNHIYVVTPQVLEGCYRAYIGPGNNGCMIRGILKRRSWWTILDKPQEANFIWTQLKSNTFFEEQPQSQLNLDAIYFEKTLKKTEKICFKENNSQPNDHQKIFNCLDLALWKEHYEKHAKSEQKINEMTYLKRVGLLNKKRLVKIEEPQKLKMQNHLFANYYIGNKKALFYNLKKYYKELKRNVFEIIPLTFHISKGIEDPAFEEFIEQYEKIEEKKKTEKDLKNMWIMKPGQNSNRGNGINVCFGLDDIKIRLKGKERNHDGTLRTFILQKYIEKPLLYKHRKFDLRHYILITSFSGAIKAYWYQQGYVRTSSTQYHLKQTKDLFAHLTNDAIQKHGSGYGKYEPGNKLSYEELQKYIAKISNKEKEPISFMNDILPQMKFIATEAVKSTYGILDNTRREHNFELLGLDFMIDDDYKPCLIEVNTNPCLELSCPLLSKLIPEVIENTMRLCIDSFFPPPENFQVNKRSFFNTDNPLADNRFEIIFDEVLDGKNIQSIRQTVEELDSCMGKIEEDAEIFENDGEEEWTAVQEELE